MYSIHFTKIISKTIAVIVTIAVILSMMAGTAIAAEENAFYVSPSGSDTNPGTFDKPWQTIAYAGEKLEPGDTLYVMEGIYAGDYFYPVNSGTPDKPITVKAYEGHKPVLTAGTGSPIEIMSFDNDSYIVIDGLSFEDTGDNTNVCIYYSQGIIIRNCMFKNSSDSFMYVNESSYITIEHNEFDTCGSPAGEGSNDAIYVNGSNHVLIENNYFTKAGHYAVDLKEMNGKEVYSYNNVIRNNIIEQHWGGGIGIICKSYNNLVENNLIYYAGEECKEYGKTGIQIAAEKNIVRNNLVAKTSVFPYADPGIFLSSYYFQPRDMYQNCIDNRIYNNVVYNTGGMPIQFSAKHDTHLTRNRIFNNILYYNRLAGDNYDDSFKGNIYTLFETWHLTLDKLWADNFPNDNYYYNNIVMHANESGDVPNSVKFYYDGVANVDNVKTWGKYSFMKSLDEIQQSYPEYFYDNLEINPGFVDAENGDFRISPDSAAYDAGAHLTVTTSQGTDTTTVHVEDALFFTDGYGIIDGDIVKIGDNSPVNIVSVNYTENTITVSTPVTFREGDYVDLAFYGNGPDIGMAEYDPDSKPMVKPRTEAAPIIMPEPEPEPESETEQEPGSASSTDKTGAIIITASKESEGCEAVNTMDGISTEMDSENRWSADCDWAYIVYDLGTEQTVGSLDIDWYNALNQQTTFDITLSGDGNNFGSPVYRGTCEAKTGFQTFSFDAQKARYIKITGHYNNNTRWGMWVSITEVQINDDQGSKLDILSAVANRETGENIASCTIDGITSETDSENRWSAESFWPYITYDMGTAHKIGYVDIDWYNSLNQQTTFDILLSTDGTTFTNVYSGTCEKMTGFQRVPFDEQEARYVRIVGRGSNNTRWGMWISISEVKLPGIADMQFADLEGYGWAKDAISSLAAKGIARGVGQNMFNPSGKITKGDFILLLTRALNIPYTGEESSFSDVKEGNMYYPAISAAYKLGIAEGETDTVFGVNHLLTRQEMGEIIANVLTKVKGMEAAAESGSFIDKFKDKDDISSQYHMAVATAVKHSIMSGTAQGMFLPIEYATRAEAAVVTDRLMSVK